MSRLTNEGSVQSGAISTAALDNLAARFRGGGLCLILLRQDGTVGFHDRSAGAFFQRYVVPMLQFAESGAPRGDMRRLLDQIDVASGVAIWTFLPGVLLAAIPFVERRQLLGTLVLAAKRDSFQLSEEISDWCGRLGIDRRWLSQEAQPLPPYSDAEMCRQSRLLLTMMRDQLRLAGLESELDGLSNQLSNTYEELTLIYEISRGMRINRRAGDFFQQACLDLLQVMDVGGMGVALCPDAQKKPPVISVGPASDSPQANLPSAQSNGVEPVLYGELSLPPGTVPRLAEMLLPLLCQRKAPLQINDLQKDPVFSWLHGHVRNLLALPMQRQDEVLGCYFALDKVDADFDSQDSKLLNSIANESAIYLENARLFDDAHDLMMGLLHSLTSAVDAKDTYTHGHSERVAAVGRELTIRAGLGEPLADRVYMAGLLHDVGKIGVPESVLQKTGRLTPEEFEQMKKHPLIGARILSDVKQVEDLIPGVLHHHERYDGRGYPHGLAGEKIPLFGRLICLADCFDAMTSNRTYRQAMPLEVALTEIRRCSGTQFDPVLTEAFLAIGAPRLRELVQRAKAEGMAGPAAVRKAIQAA